MAEGTTADQVLQTPVFQSAIPFELDRRNLPGVVPLDPAEWIIVDDAFAGQMACRDALIATRPDAVLRVADGAGPAVHELLRVVLEHLPDGYRVEREQVARPDGVVIEIDWENPLPTLTRLVQEDFCILEKQGTEHVLTAATLCFPSSWHLDDKFLRPLTTIHDPIDSYTPDIARRVQRLFDGVRPGRPLWRFNRLWYAEPHLHQPRHMNMRRQKPDGTQPVYFRCERQSILRLPETGAVVFSIHTFIMPEENAPDGACLS